jgi:uncharacterized protein
VTSARRARAFAAATIMLATALVASRPTGALAAETAVPELTGPVVDLAHLLSPSDAARLTDLARRVRADQQGRGVQMQFLVVPTLAGEAIEELAIRVAERWQIGSRGKDNGLLFVLARDEHKVRIEVGAGLEGDLTDAQSSRIVREVLVPSFRARDFGGGFLRAAARALSEMKLPLPPGVVIPDAPSPGPAPEADAKPPARFPSLDWFLEHSTASVLFLMGLFGVGSVLTQLVFRSFLERHFPRWFAARAPGPTVVASAALPVVVPPPERSRDEDRGSSSDDSSWSGGGGTFGGGGASGDF